MGLLLRGGAAAVRPRRRAARRARCWRVAFLPVFYSHLALNDVPDAGAVCLALVGRGGRAARRAALREYALAGVGARPGLRDEVHGAGSCCCLLAAAGAPLAPPAGARGARVGASLLAGVARAGGLRRRQPVRAAGLRARSGRPAAPVRGRRRRAAASSASPEQRGPLLPRGRSPGGWAGCRWWPPPAARSACSCATAGCARRARPRAAAVPAVHGHARSASSPAGCCRSTRSLCLLAAWAVVAARLARARRAPALAPALPCSARCSCAARGVVFSVHSDVVLRRDDTRQLARDWMVDNVPIALEGRGRARSCPTAWAADAESVDDGHRPTASAGTSSHGRSPSPTTPDSAGGGVIAARGLRAHTRPGPDRRLRPRRLLLGGHRLDPVRPRRSPSPKQVPKAIEYYAALRRDARSSSTRSRPPRGRRRAVLLRLLLQRLSARPTSGMGPEIRIYRLGGGEMRVTYPPGRP